DQRPPVVDALHHRALRVLAQDTQGVGERVRGQGDVGIEEEQDVAGRGPGPGVARGGRALVDVKTDESYGELPDDGAGVVGAGVVHHDDLGRRVGLREHRGETGPERPGLVVVGDDDRHAGYVESGHVVTARNCTRWSDRKSVV